MFEKPHPMLDFSLKNISKIKEIVKCDFVIFREGNKHSPVYKVKNRFEEKIHIVINSDVSSDAVFRDFEVKFTEIKLIYMCQKTDSCQFTSEELCKMRRHKSSCTNVQQTVSTQVAYGEDKTPVKQLVDMKILPKEALQFRKTLFTTFDIECCENLDIADDLHNVVARHEIVSIAASTNRGHSKCLVRADSSHDAVVVMIDKFLNFLEEMNIIHDAEMPEYFHHAVTQLEEMTSEESSILKSEKMKLTKLCNDLKKYLLHDVFGYNSGICTLSI